MQHAQHHSEDAALMSLHEEGKGILVPTLAGSHELSVVLLGRLRDDAWKSYFQGVRQLHQSLVPTDLSFDGHELFVLCITVLLRDQ